MLVLYTSFIHTFVFIYIPCWYYIFPIIMEIGVLLCKTNELVEVT